MKNPKLTLMLLPLLTLLLSACGKLSLESEKKNSKLPSAVVVNPLAPDVFQAECSKVSGVLVANGTVCTYKTASASVTSVGELFDQPIANVQAGNALTAVGYVSGNSVEIVLNGSTVLSGLNGSKTIILPAGGALAFRVRPGYSDGVKAYVYTCLNQGWQPTTCPL